LTGRATAQPPNLGPSSGHTFEITFLDPGVQACAITFG
jgi:hypothetical protein